MTLDVYRGRKTTQQQQQSKERIRNLHILSPILSVSPSIQKEDFIKF